MVAGDEYAASGSWRWIWREPAGRCRERRGPWSRSVKRVVRGERPIGRNGTGFSDSLERLTLGLVVRGHRPEPWVMKSSSCTSLVFIRIPLRVVPSLEKGRQGGYPRVTTAWCAVPGRLSSPELSHRPNVLALPLNPPCPPFARGGRTNDAQQKHTSSIHHSSSVNPNFSTPQGSAGWFAPAAACAQSNR